MKLKLDEKGYAVISDGKPVYVHDDGKEMAFDAVGTVSTIARLNQEAKTHRENAEGLAGRLSAFVGIDDPTAAKKALDTVRNLDDKKLVDAGQVETVRSEAIKATEEKYKPIIRENEELKKENRAEKIGGGFARSKYVAEKLAIPVEVVESFFGHHFKVESGRAVAYYQNGNQVFSRTRPGEVADFDEALEQLVEQYPNKDHILKGNNATGSGASGRPGVPMTEDLSSLSPTERINAARRRAKR